MTQVYLPLPLKPTEPNEDPHVLLEVGHAHSNLNISKNIE